MRSVLFAVALCALAAATPGQTLIVNPVQLNGQTVGSPYIAIGDQLCVRFELPAPDRFVFLLFGQPGSLAVPGVGTIPLANYLILNQFFVSGTTTYDFAGCDLPCDPAFIGLTGALAFVTVDPATFGFGISNAIEVEVVAPLGPAGAFDAYASGDVSGLADVEGRLAAGGNVTLQNFGLGAVLAPDPTRKDLVVGGDATLTNGQLHTGSGLYAGSGAISSVGTPVGSLAQASSATVNACLDFADNTAFLAKRSETFPQWPQNGTVSTSSWGSLILQGGDPVQNIFTITSQQWATAAYMSLTVPASSTVLINVPDATHTLSGFALDLGGHAPTQVLVNFHEATAINLSNIAFNGTILAPRASVSLSNAQVNGQVMAASISSTSSGEVHHVGFAGCLSLVYARNAVGL